MIHFTLLRVPVHIHFSFWVAVLAWGAAITTCEPHPVNVLFFALAVFVCLLVHEIGHALVGRRYMQGEEVGLCFSWLGGACCSESEPSWSLRQGICVTLAGPIAGLLVAAAVWGGLCVAAQSVQGGSVYALHMLKGEIPPELDGACPVLILYFTAYLLQVSTWWGCLNLLPIYPLDGGVVMHDLMDGTHVAHSISLATTCLLAVAFMAVGVWAVAALMIFLSYYNYRCILAHTE